MTEMEYPALLRGKKPGFSEKLKDTVCTVIICASLLIILVLAIPVCLFTMLIHLVRNLADKALRVLG